MSPHAGIMGTVDPPVLPPARGNRPCVGVMCNPGDTSEHAIRCLGIVGSVVEVEWPYRRGKPTAWLALDDHRLARVRAVMRRLDQL